MFYGTFIKTLLGKASLVQNGETWMLPLLKYRNILSRSTSPKLKKKYRSHIRRDGRLAFKTLREDGEKILTDDYTTGPYKLNVPELHAVRHEWLNDPNEPDWDDDLPIIFNEVFGYDLDWSVDDTNQFSREDAALITEIAPAYGVSPQLVKKLIDLEISMSGLSRRTGIYKKIGRLIQQDWESAEEIIKQNKDSRQNQINQSKEVQDYEFAA